VYKIIYILFVLLLFCDALNAQKKLTPKEVDAKTFTLYTSGKWDALKEECENAIDNDIDFFYLRLRAGIAYYNNTNYMSAIKHFEKAMEYNPTDLITMEYLYYSYLLSGRESDVLALISVMPYKLKKKLDVYNKFVYGVYTEGGFTTNGDKSHQKLKNFISPPLIFNEQRLVDNETYISLNLKHQIGRRVKVFHGYNNISLSSVKQISEKTLGHNDFDLTTKQDEYYFNINFNLGSGFDLTTAVHYLHIRDEDVKVEYKNYVNPPLPVYAKVSEKTNDFVSFISLTKYFGHFKTGLKNSFSNLNKATQFQNTVQIVYFPFGNLNFYSVTDATLFSNEDWGTGFKSNGILDQKAGLNIFDNLWIEGGYTFGYIYNFNESDAFIVFNNTDRISNRASINLIAPISRHIELSARYQYYNLEVTSFSNTEPNPDNTHKIFTNNINHKIIGGLKWTF